MPDDPKPSITPAPNGPYLLKNLERLTNRRGSVETKASIALCRCGQSKNKPFCDGSHKRVGFDSSKHPDRGKDRRRDYVGKQITVHDNRGVCAHSGHCTDHLPDVFRSGEKPWIASDAAPVDKVIERVRQCPSGALSYSIDGVEQHEPSGEAHVHVSENGPYIVTGRIDLLETEMPQGARPERCTLCRCGGSKNKPFCDGSHWYNGFKDEKN
jgi:CDGSH-type Zn-finger protein